MPKHTSTDAGTRREPVPVGLFLALARRPGTRRGALAAPDLPHWHGLAPGSLAYLIRRYTRCGDVVLDLDAHPSVAAAARYLRRAPARLVPAGHSFRVRLLSAPHGARRPRREVRRPGPGAALVLVTLPRAGESSLDLHGTTRAIAAWRPLVRPGGFLIAALTARGSQPATISHRSTVIAAARTAGLIYHQHIPVLLVPLPEHDPHTGPEAAGEPEDGRRLLAGRHLPAYRDLVVLAGTATGEEATHA